MQKIRLIFHSTLLIMFPMLLSSTKVKKVETVPVEAISALTIPSFAIARKTNQRNQEGLVKYTVTFMNTLELFNPEQIGKRIKVSVPLGDKTHSLSARVTEESPGKLTSYFYFYDQTIKGMTVSWNSPIRTANIFAVPLRSIVAPDGKQKYLYKVEANKTVRIPIEFIKLSGERVFISADDSLSLGDRIVSKGLIDLLDEQVVEVTQ